MKLDVEFEMPIAEILEGELRKGHVDLEAVVVRALFKMGQAIRRNETTPFSELEKQCRLWGILDLAETSKRQVARLNARVNQLEPYYARRLAHRLRHARQVAGLSLAEAAVMASIDEEELRKIESRMSAYLPTPAKLDRLIRIYTASNSRFSGTWYFSVAADGRASDLDEETLEKLAKELNLPSSPSAPKKR